MPHIDRVEEKLSTLDRVLDIPAYFDLIDRFEGMVSTFIHADWRGAWERRGPLGLIAEFVSCLSSHNSPEIRVSRYTAWRGIDVERLLKRHGVKVWDRGIIGPCFYFRVKQRQVKWAEYVLLRAGVTMVGKAYEPGNDVWTAKYPPRSEPPNRTQRRRSRS
jgi:hypothetical protein